VALWSWHYETRGQCACSGPVRFPAGGGEGGAQSEVDVPHCRCHFAARDLSVQKHLKCRIDCLTFAFLHVLKSHLPETLISGPKTFLPHVRTRLRHHANYGSCQSGAFCLL
jgi:hypothetical protein